MPGRINTVGYKVSGLEIQFLCLVPGYHYCASGIVAGVELEVFRAVILERMAVDALLLHRLGNEAVVVQVSLLEIRQMPLAEQYLSVI